MSWLIPLNEYFGGIECEGSWDDPGNLQWSMDTDEYAKAVQRSWGPTGPDATGQHRRS